MTADILFAICVAAMAGIVLGQLGNYTFGVLLILAVLLIFL